MAQAQHMNISEIIAKRVQQQLQSQSIENNIQTLEEAQDNANEFPHFLHVSNSHSSSKNKPTSTSTSGLYQGNCLYLISYLSFSCHLSF